jgi:hypothetical protein
MLARPAHRGPLDGAWWPRTKHPAIELTALTASLATRGVVPIQVSLSVTAWGSTPGRVRQDDRDVRLVWLALQAPHTVLVRHSSGQITLLVIPPEATEESATRVAALVLDPSSLAGPHDILAAAMAWSDTTA